MVFPHQQKLAVLTRIISTENKLFFKKWRGGPINVLGGVPKRYREVLLTEKQIQYSKIQIIIEIIQTIKLQLRIRENIF